MLDKLRLNDTRKVTPADFKTSAAPVSQNVFPIDTRKASLHKDVDIKTESDASSARDMDRFSGSELYTPATEAFDESVKVTNAEMERVKRELEAAKSVISQQQRDLEDARNFKHTMEQALPSPSEAEFPRSDIHTSAVHRQVCHQDCQIMPLTCGLVPSIRLLAHWLVSTGPPETLRLLIFQEVSRMLLAVSSGLKRVGPVS